MNEGQRMRHVYWPAALTWMFSSLHTSVGFALIGAVVGEYLGSAAGLGYKIQQAESVFDVTGVFSGMLVLALFVIALDAVVTLRSEEHTSELQSLMRISYAVFCLKKKKLKYLHH